MFMQKSIRVHVAAAICVAILAFAPLKSEAADPPAMTGARSSVAFWGFNAKEDAYYLYAGFVHALSGDIGQEGWLVKGVVGFGEYDYKSLAVAGGDVDGDTTQLEASVGYQMFTDAMRLSGYVGVVWEDHDLSPNDPTNSTQGDEFGVKLQAEAVTLASSPLYAGLMGSYASPNDGYWVRGRLGYRLGGIVIGPEGLLMGNDEYDGQRIGAFIGGFNLGSLNVSLSGGYADVDGTQGNSSVYGAIDFSLLF